MYTYNPKVGDVVRFPNGVEVNYSEHDETIVVSPPKGKRLRPSQSTGDNLVIIATVPS